MSIANSKKTAQSHSYDYWLKKNWYFHKQLAHFYHWMIPENSTVLQVGCKTGHILAHACPEKGIGIEDDIDCLTIAQDKYPNYSFYQSLHQIPGQSFDYIILSSICMEVDDIQQFLINLQPFCHNQTRIIIDMYSTWWEPLLWLIQWLGLRRPTALKNWISLHDMNNFLYLSNFEMINSGRYMALPCYIPFIATFVNAYVTSLPIFNRLCLMNWIVARPSMQHKQSYEYAVSIIVPCKNEQGNINTIIRECPDNLGKSTELIFVEGHSSDNTFATIEHAIKEFSQKNIRLFKQSGKGKGDAVRTGFEYATGDIVMIFDADCTVPGYELHKFYNALAEHKGDFINGSRLVYGMETDAMRWLNVLANYLFGIGFSWLLNQDIKDTLCGTKVLFKKDYQRIAKNRTLFGDFDPFGDFDLLFGAAKLHLKIIDMPVHYKARVYGTTQIRRFYHGLLLLRMSWFGLKKFKFRL